MNSLTPPEPDVPWVMVGRVVWWASQPHGPGDDGSDCEPPSTFPSWACSSRDEIGPTHHLMPNWAALWAYAEKNNLPVITPGEALR